MSTASRPVLASHPFNAEYHASRGRQECHFVRRGLRPTVPQEDALRAKTHYHCLRHRLRFRNALTVFKKTHRRNAVSEVLPTEINLFLKKRIAKSQTLTQTVLVCFGPNH